MLMRTSRCLSLLAAVALVAGFGWIVATRGAEPPTMLAPPALDNPKESGRMQRAVLAGGCFWGVQGVFEHVRGVHTVLAGYSGGSSRTAQYQDVGLGNTGHAESVEIIFDPQQVSYGQLLQIYFAVAHDPTQLDRQGPDTGSQYRSQIFYADDMQRQIAESYITQLNKDKAFPASIVTRVDRLNGFYPAEAYHQDFYLKNPDYPYIVINDLPKIRNLQRLFPQSYRDTPVTVGVTAGR
jgi:peptide-methionine (S)-S-oxide reductase